MSALSNNQLGAMIEDLEHQIQRFAEAMADLPVQVRSIDERMQTIEQDVWVIRAAVVDQTKRGHELEEVIHQHEEAIARLQKQAA